MINQLSDEYVLLPEITMLLSLAVWLFALTNRILQTIKPHKIESFGLNANQRAVALQKKKRTHKISIIRNRYALASLWGFDC